MKNYKWGTESFSDNPVNVVLFVSRNKDNKDIEGFSERRMSFITNEPKNSEKLYSKFLAFVNAGKDGELSRMYYSINERNPNKIYKTLVHFLIDNPNFNLCSIQPKLAGIAAMKECALSKKWLFDFDFDDIKLANEFVSDINSICPDIICEINETPHGFAIVTNRGFDIRGLNMWLSREEVSLKKDALLCIRWETK